MNKTTCSTCGGPTTGQHVLQTASANFHRHKTDCVAFLKTPVPGVPAGMRIKEVMHLETEPSTGIVYGQVILERIPV